MTKKKNINPTDAELDILRVLWSHGPGTVKEIHEQLPGKPPRGYTTVLKLLQIMSEKDLVARDERRRAHVYRACYSIEYTQRKLLSRLMDKAFDSSAGKLVVQALSAKPASREELQEIRRLLDKLEGGKK
ncbi:MAG: BlaI/MecI/CopY family transcriptional regulator [candidate division Zixibacteria bacterium]|nr:BlaI/MecI/CopY family transcriptional regulator [candidate division Zixibacteria bacterium]